MFSTSAMPAVGNLSEAPGTSACSSSATHYPTDGKEKVRHAPFFDYFIFINGSDDFYGKGIYIFRSDGAVKHIIQSFSGFLFVRTPEYF